MMATRYRATATAGIEYPADNRLKAFAFIDNASQPAYTNGTWEYEVPNGTYEVAVSVGDAGFLGSDTEADLAALWPAATRERLVAVKRAWDPDNTFRRNFNVSPH